MWLFKRAKLVALLTSTLITVIILLVLFYFTWSRFSRNTLINNVVFVEGSQEWPRFQSTSDIKNLRLSFHLFNVTNANEFVASKGTIKLNVSDVGPFVYDIIKTKEIIDANSTTGLITYKLRTIYNFNQNLSISDANATSITWVNIPLLVSLHYVNLMNPFLKIAAEAVINNYILKFKEPPFIQDTAANFILDGSKRLMFVSLQENLPFIKPWPFPNNKFALLYGKNDTWVQGVDPIFTVSAGTGGNQTLADLNQLKFLNYKNELPYWYKKPSSCNKIYGTDGQFFAPFLNSSSNLSVYLPDICRKVRLQYIKNRQFEGVDSLGFIISKENFLSYKKNPDNLCYCLERDDKGQPLKECSFDGIIDLQTCNKPNILASLAHFHGGSPELSSRLNGIDKSNSSKYQPRLFVEPNTGNTINVNTPVQFNVRMRKNPFINFDFFRDEDPIIIPLAWVAETSTLTSDQASLLESLLVLLNSWLMTAVLLGAVVFIGLLIVCAIYFYYKYFTVERQVALSEATETDPLLPATTITTHDG